MPTRKKIQTESVILLFMGDSLFRKRQETQWDGNNDTVGTTVSEVITYPADFNFQVDDTRLIDTNHAY